jgi:hypothetical protein
VLFVTDSLVLLKVRNINQDDLVPKLSCALVVLLPRLVDVEKTRHHQRAHTYNVPATLAVRDVSFLTMGGIKLESFFILVWSQAHEKMKRRKHKQHENLYFEDGADIQATCTVALRSDCERPARGQ